jgi:hypothetical protein
MGCLRIAAPSAGGRSIQTIARATPSIPAHSRGDAGPDASLYPSSRLFSLLLGLACSVFGGHGIATGPPFRWFSDAEARYRRQPLVHSGCKRLLGHRWGFLLERAGPVCNLTGSTVTDADLSALKDLKGLQYLYLSLTQVTDAGLAHLKDFKGLKYLYLSGTLVTDAGLAHLKDLKGLQGLDLRGTQVKDAGLAHLKDLKGLQWLYLKNTKVTDAGIEALGRALPGCFIVP